MAEVEKERRCGQARWQVMEVASPKSAIVPSSSSSLTNSLTEAPSLLSRILQAMSTSICGKFGRHASYLPTYLSLSESNVYVKASINEHECLLSATCVPAYTESKGERQHPKKLDATRRRFLSPA